MALEAGTGVIRCAIVCCMRGAYVDVVAIWGGVGTIRPAAQKQSSILEFEVNNRL
jgi:hypothetical protein